MSEMVDSQVSAGKVLDKVQLKSFSISDEKLNNDTYSLKIQMEAMIPFDRVNSTVHFVVFDSTEKKRVYHTYITIDIPINDEQNEELDLSKPGLLRGESEINIEGYNSNNEYHLYISNIMPEKFDNLDISDIKDGAFVNTGIPMEELVSEGV